MTRYTPAKFIAPMLVAFALATSPAAADSKTNSASVATSSTSGVMSAAKLNLTQENLASKILGSSVYNKTGANIGSVTDLLVKDAGSIDGFIVDVGGFLGFYQTPVVIPADKISISFDGNTLRVVADVTKADLTAATK